MCVCVVMKVGLLIDVNNIIHTRQETDGLIMVREKGVSGKVNTLFTVTLIRVFPWTVCLCVIKLNKEIRNHLTFVYFFL